MLERTVHWNEFPLKDLPIFQLYYLSACNTPSDPTIVWGTDIRMEAVESFLRTKNSTGSVLLSPAHVLISNVARTMNQHREFNCRVTRRRIFEYNHVNLMVPLFNPGGSEINTLWLEQVPSLSLEQIAQAIWNQTSHAAQGRFDSVEDNSWLERLPAWVIRLATKFHVWNHNHFNYPRMKHLSRENRGSMLVNYFGFRNAPPLTSYKPSRFPLDGAPFSITMGATVDKPVVDNGQVVPGRVAPLFLRADHRLVDAYQMRAFLETLIAGFKQPELLEADDADIRSAA